MYVDQFTNNGRFLMLALDHRESLKKILNPLNPFSVTDDQIINLKSQIIDVLKDQFSGILIDPEYGLPAYKSFDFAQDKPYLLCIEKSGYRDSSGERLIEIEYSVDKLKELGASGIKLLIYFNPYDRSSEAQMKTVEKVLNECQSKSIPFFLEIVTYHNDDSILQKTNIVIESVRKFVDSKLIPDVFKLEYPCDEESCKKITFLVGKTPWILLTRGENFEIFKVQLKNAMISGASGFLAGRALWQEVGKIKEEAERMKFLTEIVPSRFREITQIVMKNSFLA